MTLTFQDVLNDAKKLSTKLKDHETAAEALVSQMQAVYHQVEAMKQYNDDVAQLNDLASERPRMALVAGIQQENKHIMDLQQENRELRSALEEQQNAIDLIMSKYRQHVSKLTQCQKFDQQLLKTIDTNSQVIESSAEKINEMKYIMRKAITSDEEAIMKEEELISRLWTENKGLRELLQISGKYGSLNNNTITAEMEDKEVQTELNTEDSNRLSSTTNATTTPTKIEEELSPSLGRKNLNIDNNMKEETQQEKIETSSS